MKKSLFILALFLGLGNINAQSDATLEETVKWLNYYGIKENLLHYELDNTPMKLKIEWNVFLDTNDSVNFELRDRYFKEFWRPNCSKGPESYNFNLSDVKEISLQESAHHKKYFFVRLRFNESIKNKNSDYVCGLTEQYIWFNEKQKAVSLFKALKHLNSFYNTDIKFENLTELENKF